MSNSSERLYRITLPSMSWLNDGSMVNDPWLVIRLLLIGGWTKWKWTGFNVLYAVLLCVLTIGELNSKFPLDGNPSDSTNAAFWRRTYSKVRCSKIIHKTRHNPVKNRMYRGRNILTWLLLYPRHHKWFKSQMADLVQKWSFLSRLTAVGYLKDLNVQLNVFGVPFRLLCYDN